MLSLYQLMKYLRSKHNINIKSNQTQHLRNLGYYHGYKGYRFIRTPNQKVNFTTFDEVLALNHFDMQLKALFYPKVMIIENALKSYVIESVLSDAKSESLDILFNKSITYYKSFTPGSEKYKFEYTKRMELKSKINNALKRDYSNKQQIASHFFDTDRTIPVWAIFESLTLGEFGTFFSCLKEDVKLHTSSLLKLPTNYDADGKLSQFVIYTIKDLRNAVAHNNIIFDTRFQTGKINNRLISCLKSETRIININFSSIDAYIILITYVLRKMRVSKTECRQFVRAFITLTELLRSQIPINMYNQIIGTNVKFNMQLLETFISKS